MNRRTFVATVTAGLACLGFLRWTDAQPEADTPFTMENYQAMMARRQATCKHQIWIAEGDIAVCGCGIERPLIRPIVHNLDTHQQYVIEWFPKVVSKPG